MAHTSAWPQAPPGGWVTRLAPSPTGALHAGHLLHLIWLFGLARQMGARVLLRLEDHDRVRCRPDYTPALLATLAQLGIRADGGFTGAQPDPYCQSHVPQRYASALDQLAQQGRLYACDCSRSQIRQRLAAQGHALAPGDELTYDGHCRHRGLPLHAAGVGLRARLEAQPWAFADLLLGPQRQPPPPDPLLRDRTGLYTYTLCVVADDLAHHVNLIIRGRDVLAATAGQLALRSLLSTAPPPTFAHHPLLLTADGRKLSKAAADAAVADALAAGASPAALFGRAAHKAGLLLDQGELPPSAFAAAVARALAAGAGASDAP